MALWSNKSIQKDVVQTVGAVAVPSMPPSLADGLTKGIYPSGDGGLSKSAYDDLEQAIRAHLSHPSRPSMIPTSGPGVTSGPDFNGEAWRHYAIAMRLRIPHGAKLPFAHLSTAAAGETIHVFVLPDGSNESVTLKDDAGMFPSDTLITQLRLLVK